MQTLFDPSSKKSINNKFRRNRFNHFLGKLNTTFKDDFIKILDVGGTEEFWEQMDFSTNPKVHITLLNLETTDTRNPGFLSVKGNACNMPEFNDNHFDLVFSNSVIEHLFTFSNQQQMANEVKRIGRYYYIQTPNFYFPIEPHWMFPFYQFLPNGVQVLLTETFDLGHYKKAKSRKEAVSRVNEVQLLTKKKMQVLFPDCTIYEEKFLGFTKSLTAFNLL